MANSGSSNITTTVVLASIVYLANTFVMGSSSSKHVHSSNDFELVIKSSRVLEGTLAEGFGAVGKGLHEKITSVNDRLPDDLISKMRYLATIRNELVHGNDCNQIKDRKSFISTFESCVAELKLIIEQREGKESRGSSCIVM